MANAVENLVYCLRTILIRVTVGPISFIFLELSKFALVLALAFWITVGIFMMWESIMPEAASRLSAAAAAVVANSSGLMPSDEGKENANQSSNYPFVVDLPKTESSTLETQRAELEGKSPTALENVLPGVKSVAETAKEEIKNDISKAEVASAGANVSQKPSEANGSEPDDSGYLIE